MPIKYGEIQDAQLYMEQDGELKPLGHLSGLDLSIEPDNTAYEFKSYLKSESITFSAKINTDLRAFYIFITTGNDLYLRFPKKLRRKRNILGKGLMHFTKID